MNRTMDDLEKDMLTLAEAVDVVTIPNPKPRTLRQHVSRVTDHVLDFAGRVVVTDRYVGRHRAQPVINIRPRLPRPPSVLRRLMDAGTRLDLRVLATLESVGRPPQDVQKALTSIRNTADRAKRDISFYHTYLNGMTDIGERGVKCSS